MSFNNFTGLRDESCYTSYKTHKNKQISDYWMPSYHVGDMGRNSRKSYFSSLSEPGMYLSNDDGKRTVVGVESKLQKGNTSRAPYAIPEGMNVLKRNSQETWGDIVISKESQLRKGDKPPHLKTRKITEKSYDRFVPLIPSLQKSVQDPKHIIPTMWKRGGEDTREMVKNIDYVSTLCKRK